MCKERAFSLFDGDLSFNVRPIKKDGKTLQNGCMENKFVDGIFFSSFYNLKIQLF